MVTSAARRIAVDRAAVAGLGRWLWFFMIITVTLELLEIIMLAYEKAEAWHIIGPLLTTRLEFSFISVQMIIGSLIPFILLMIIVLMDKYLHERVRNTLLFTASLLLLMQVFAMRWNVVIGGQLLSKSLRGLRETYSPQLFGKEGVLMAIALFLVPFGLMYIYNRVLPLWADEKDEPGAEAHATPANN